MFVIHLFQMVKMGEVHSKPPHKRKDTKVIDVTKLLTSQIWVTEVKQKNVFVMLSVL